MFRNIEKKIFFPAVAVLLLLLLPIYLIPDKVNGIVSFLFDQCTGQFGWIFLLTCLASFGFLIWLTTSRYGNIRLGGTGDKPQYGNLSWVAMLFTAGS